MSNQNGNGAAAPQASSAPVTGPLPEWGPWHEPFFAVVYAPLGVGKSLDLCRLGAADWILLGQEGGLKPALSELHVDLDRRRQRRIVHTLDEATAYAEAIGAQPDRGGWRGMGIDDLSLLIENTHRTIMRDPPLSDRGRPDFFKAWDMTKDKVHRLATALRWAGLHCMANAHERGPGREEKTGEWYKGGPATPSMKITRFLGHHPDTVLRGGTEPGRRPWHGTYLCLPEDGDFSMKDRHGYSGILPMNMAELMRGVGYILRRPPGLEWQEQVAEGVAQAILGGRAAEEVCAKAAHNLYHKHHFDPLHIRWAVHQDGVDRAAIRRLRGGLLAKLGIGVTPEAGPQAPVEPAGVRVMGLA